MQNNNNNDNNNDDPNLHEPLADIVQLNHAEQKRHTQQQMTGRIVDIIHNHNADQAAEMAIEQIKDPELKHRAMKQLQDKRDKVAKEAEKEKARLAAVAISGHHLCINIKSNGEQCARSADPNHEHYGFLCKQCYNNKRRQELNNLTPEQRFAEKQNNKTRKREREVEAAAQKEAQLEMVRQRLNEKKRMRGMPFGGVVAPVRQAVPQQQQQWQQNPVYVSNDAQVQRNRAQATDESFDLNRDLMDLNLQQEEEEDLTNMNVEDEKEEALEREQQEQDEQDDEDYQADAMGLSSDDDNDVSDSDDEPNITCSVCNRETSVVDTTNCPKCKHPVHVGCTENHKC